jgi:hypothetical protein
LSAIWSFHLLVPLSNLALGPHPGQEIFDIDGFGEKLAHAERHRFSTRRDAAAGEASAISELIFRSLKRCGTRFRISSARRSSQGGPAECRDKKSVHALDTNFAAPRIVQARNNDGRAGAENRTSQVVRFGRCISVVRTLPEIEIKIAAGDGAQFIPSGFNHRTAVTTPKGNMDWTHRRGRSKLHPGSSSTRAPHFGESAERSGLVSIACARRILANLKAMHDDPFVY